MADIEVLESGHIDRSDSAFPTLVRLDNGEIVCGYSVGSGPDVSGGTHWSCSTDQGRTWTHEGEILAPTDDPPTTNHLRLSRTRDDKVLAYGARNYPDPDVPENEHPPDEPVLCVSVDGAHTWSAPKVMPNSVGKPLEISCPIVVTADGRWLAPAASVTRLDRYGEIVVVFESSDDGKTWPNTHTVLEHPEHRYGYLEQKLIETAPGHMMAVCWTMDYTQDGDVEDHFALSHDGGRTWGKPHSTGIRGQTMTPTWLGDDRLLVLYNRRYGDQGVQMCLVRFTETDWHVDFEGTLWDARTSHTRAPSADSIEELNAFAFGLPSATRLDDEHFLAVHWCKEDGVFGIRWTRLRVSL